MGLTSEERKLYGRIGALRMHALNDSRLTSKPGRDKANGRFEREVRERFPDIADDELERRAALLRRAWMTEIAAKSVAARRRRAAR